MLWESRRKGEGLGEGDDPSQIGMDLGMTRMELGVALIFYPGLQDSWGQLESLQQVAEWDMVSPKGRELCNLVLLIPTVRKQDFYRLQAFKETERLMHCKFLKDIR